MGKALKVSQEELLEHSEIKVRLLKHYLEAYVNILGHSQHFDRLYFFDLFCGPGIYNNKGEGSPIILLKEIKKLKQESSNWNVNQTKFNCYFNDIESSKIESLKSAIRNLNLFHEDWGNLEFRNLDYKNTHYCPVINQRYSVD
jgi:three-Cys-motif partner protein